MIEIIVLEILTIWGCLYILGIVIGFFNCKFFLKEEIEFMINNNCVTCSNINNYIYNPLYNLFMQIRFIYRLKYKKDKCP